jgi:hypothetical protein
MVSLVEIKRLALEALRPPPRLPLSTWEEMSALRQGMADALTPRQIFASAQRVEKVWLH